MTTAFGVSIGSTSLRIARVNRREGESAGGTSVDEKWTYSTRPVARVKEQPLASASDCVRTLREENGDNASIGVALVRAELRRNTNDEINEYLQRVSLVGDARAAIRDIRRSGIVASYDTVAVYDLGATGLSVSLFDTGRGVELGAARSTVASGDLFDSGIQDHLVRNDILSTPSTAEEQSAVATFCRGVKESLSTATLAQTPGGETLLMTRNQFEQMIYLPIEETAKIVSEVGLRCRRTARAVVVIGGGANIPVVKTILSRWLGIPVFIPDDPEMVVARGTALFAADAAAAPDAALARPKRGKTGVSPKVGFTAKADVVGNSNLPNDLANL